MAFPDGIPKLTLDNKRHTSVAVHARLRAMILDGALAPGTILSQVSLARALGVSRTPLREALRMLQEEGLVEAEVNRRSRVRGFDPLELDSLYGRRILVESLAVSITLPNLSDEPVAVMEQELERMRTASALDDRDAWLDAHRKFHHQTISLAGSSLVDAVTSYAEVAERYIRIYQRFHGGAQWAVRGEREHVELVDLARRRSPDLARATGEHLARTALNVLGDLVPAHEPTAIRAAVRMLPPVSGSGPIRPLGFPPRSS